MAHTRREGPQLSFSFSRQGGARRGVDSTKGVRPLCATTTADLLRVNQAASRAEISPTYLRQLTALGQVPYDWSPYGRVYRASDMDALKARLDQARAERKQRKELTAAAG